MQAQAQQQGQGVGAQLAQLTQPFNNGNVNNTGSPLVREQVNDSAQILNQ